jgi:hypothetical protein
LERFKQQIEIIAERWAALAWWLALAAAIAVGFGWTLGSYFLGDDFAYVEKFRRMSFAYLPRLFVQEWSEGMWGFPLRELRPVAALSFMLDARLWGVNPGGYHLTNLGLHLACSGVVMVLARAVLGGKWLPGAAAGLLFAIHPVHAEPVVWITGRVDILGAMGYLLGFYALVGFRADPTWRWLLLAWTAYGAGIFAKEVCLTLPVMALLYDVLLAPRSLRWSPARVAAPYLGWAAFGLIYYVCRAAAIGPGLGAPALDYRALGFWQELAQRQLFYLGQLFWPLERVLTFADAERARAFWIWLDLLGAVAVGALVWWWIDRARRTRETCTALFFGVIWYLVGTLPLMLTYASARHLYLASAGVCVALSALLVRLLAKRTAFTAALIALTLASGWHLRAVGRLWRESGELSRQVSASIKVVADQASPGDLLLLDVPELYEGRWMWSWASPFALRPPFQERDLARDFIVLERASVYFYPEKWAEHPSLPRVRKYVGRAWIVSALPHQDVQVTLVPPERVASVLAQPGLDLGAGGSFEHLIAALAEKKSQ